MIETLRRSPTSAPGALTLLVLIGVALGAALGAGPVWLALLLIPMLLMASVAVSLRRPEWALMALVIGLPIYPFVFSQAYAHGAPAFGLAAAKGWKEVILAVLALAVVHRGLNKVDIVDCLALAFVVITLVYLLLPLGSALDARVIAAREDAAPILLMVVCKHLPRGGIRAERILNVVIVLGVVIAVLGFINSLDATLWTNLVTLSGILPYTSSVLDAIPAAPIVYGNFGRTTFIRAGSIFFAPLSLAFFMLIPINATVARVVHGRGSWVTMACGLVCTGGLFLTLTRTAIALLPLLLAIAFLLGRSRGNLGVALVAATVILWPVLSSLNLTTRFQSTLDQTDPSTVRHLAGLQVSIVRLSQNPLGTGLGTAGSTARRFGVIGGIVNESWYFQIGTEMGIVAMLIYVLLILGVIRQLWTRARRHSIEATAALGALVGVAIGGLVLHSFEDVSTAWILWLLVGLALRAQPAISGPRRSSITDMTVVGDMGVAHAGQRDRGLKRYVPRAAGDSH